MHLHKSSQLLKNINVIAVMSRRNKGKRNRHSSVVKKDPTTRALEHFDKYYTPVYGKLWPSIRLALLSQRKYCALVNNYANYAETVTDLISEGAVNILKVAEETNILDSESVMVTDHDEETHKSDQNLPNVDLESEGENFDVISNREGNIVDIVKDVDSDLYSFMPTKKVASEIEQLKMEEAKQLSDFSIAGGSSFCDVIPETNLKFPHFLKVYAYERGNFGTFPKPRKDSSANTDYYIYDAASLLPVLALDLEPYCSVLDLCAAPGGKSLTMLQTMLPGSMTCVDSVHSRLERLRIILKQYVPLAHGRGELVSSMCRDGTRFWKKLGDDQLYDRVLVDAPCYTDRHVLSESDNNLFRPSRLEERVELPKLQRRLLFSGLQACRPGGTVVYSTCTLSTVQNDGVVEATLQRIWQETDIEVAVVDTKHMADRFSDIFNFYRICRYGQLVVPNVTANFGPMYFCKLRRIK